MEQELEIVEIEVDQDLQKQVEELLKPKGITIEDLISGFFHWCAEKPEEATAYLNRLVEEKVERRCPTWSE